ncbi:extracellular solute-binding protein [Corallincola platygyrae]|uniref:Maltodextrin-binding protein n=1 Tax=Corallincola platygyrae TaxID=1193278 RepID=A0ABW4XU65_9GAMM
MTFSTSATQLTIWHQKEAARDWLVELCKVYEQKTGVKINVGYLPTGELKTSLVRSVIDGDAPDMAWVPSDFIGDYQKLEFSVIPPELITATSATNHLQTVTYDNQHYGIPLTGGNHLLLYYNKKYVEKPATSWEELVNQADQLKAKGVKPIGWKYSESYWFVAFIPPFGGFPVENNLLTLNTPSMQETLTFYRDMTTSPLQVDASCDYDCSFARFNNGEFAYTINGDWAYTDIAKALGEDFGVALLPSLNGKPIQSMYATMSLVFPNQSLSGEKRKALIDFANYMQSFEIQQRLFSEISSFPVHEQVVAALENSADPALKVFLTQMQKSKGAPPTPAMSAAWIGIRKGFDLYMSGHASPEEATALMQRVGEHELKKSQKQSAIK